MLWPHTLEAVGEEQCECTLPHPLVLSRAHELVDDALSCVVEVAKLSLPAHQDIWRAQGEAELKAQHCKLAKGAVADGVSGLVWGKVGEEAMGRKGGTEGEMEGRREGGREGGRKGGSD